MTAPAPLVELVLRGTVLTLDAVGTRARGVAVRRGVVVALDEDALALAPYAAQVVDLDGGAVLPGFGDGHVHPLWGGVELAGPHVVDATSVGEVVDAVRRFADARPDLPWIVGGPYDPSLAPGGLFDATWLDAAVADRPVALQASDHHCAWVNTAALRAAGIDQHTTDPPAATIARRPDGSPLGTLQEWTAMDLVLRHAPATTFEEKVAGLARSTSLFAAAGVTWSQEAALHPDDVAAYLAAEQAGLLQVRVDVALRAEPGEWPQQRAAFAAARASAASSPDVSARTVKFFADGIIEAGTAALLEPYTDAPHTCGLPVWAADELAAAAAAFDADGFRLHIHAIGDSGIRSALDVQLVDPADVPRFAALGVIANVEPLWAQRDAVQRELTEPRLGPVRSARQYPLASLVAAGATLSMGSDWPVSSYRPLDGLAVAVTRHGSAGDPPGGWLPHERLPVATALAAYTSGSAFQSFEEVSRGTVAVGKRADLVWLAEDPTACPAVDWPRIEVRRTWLGGRMTYGPHPA